MVAATSVKKRKRVGTHLIQTASAPAPAPASASKPKRKRVIQKRPTYRIGLPPATLSLPPAVSPPSLHLRLPPSPPPRNRLTCCPKDVERNHCRHLKHLPKWQLRDQEAPLKKWAMGKMDDSEDDKEGRRWDKPEGCKKAKERIKMEAESSLLRDKFDQMMKTKESMTMKTLEAKLAITKKKREVQLAKVEDIREEARRKAELEEMKIKVKKEKAMKALLAREREIMTMNIKDMHEQQLEWWKGTIVEITERRRILRQSGTGGASVEHGDNSGA